MIQKNNITVTCPDCRREFDIRAWSIISAGRPFLRKREVLAGEIFRHTCPHCGKSNQFAYDCLYSRREFMLYLLPTCQGRTLPLSAEEEKVFRRMGRKFPMRLENTVDGFLDHLRVLEDKYLDKPFELVRERALQDYRRQQPQCDRLRYQGTQNGQILFSAYQRQLKVGETAVDKDLYQRALHAMQRTEFLSDPPAYIFVDQTWVRSSAVRQLLDKWF